jgi:hypothetical protein
MTTIEWTDSRREALAIFRANKTAQVSNKTAAAEARIDYRAVAWMLRAGLVRHRPLSDWVELTPAGAEQLAQFAS